MVLEEKQLPVLKDRGVIKVMVIYLSAAVFPELKPG